MQDNAQRQRRLINTLVSAIFGAGTSLAAPAVLAQATPPRPTVPERTPEMPVPDRIDDRPATPGGGESMPMTKAITSGERLREAQQEGYSEAIKGVAGVSPANSKGTPNDSVNIRGIKLNLFANYRINGGLPIVGLITVPTEDKERIETLKGANALMFGVASPAGIINLVTKRAGDVDVMSFGVAGNSFGQYGGLTDLSHRFGDAKQYGIRLNASSVHLENGIRGTGGSGRFVGVGVDARATERLTFQADYEYYDKSVLEQGGVSLLPAVNGVIPITPVPDPRRHLSGPWNKYLPYTENKVLRADFVLTPAWKVMAEGGQSDGARSRYTVRIGGYNIVTGANGLVTVNYAEQTYQNKFSRTELLGHFDTWILRHDLTLGGSVTERDSITGGQNQTTLAVRQNIFDPIVLPLPVFTRANSTLPLQASKDYGVYGYDAVGIGPKFKLLLGLRRTRDDETGGAGRTVTRVNTPAFGFLYDALPGVTAFASYMEGLEAGATAPTTAVNVNEILSSAVSKQKELGVRVSAIKGLALSGSYFEITRANAVTDPVTRIFGNSGEIEYKGFETTASYDFLRDWTLSAAGQWLKAKQVTPDPQFNGFWPENTPRLIGNLGISWRVPFVRGLRLTSSVQGVSSRYVNNQQQGTIPGYSLYNAGVSYTTRVMGKRTSFQLTGDNLANRRYWNSVQTGTYGIGMDRSFKFNIRVDL